MEDFDRQLQNIEKKVAELVMRQGELNNPSNAASNAWGVGAVIYGLGERYGQWRYEHPFMSGLLKAFGYMMGFVLLLFALWHVAATPVGKISGLQSARDRVTYTYYAIIWASRIDEGAIVPMEPERRPGSIEQVIDDVMVVSYYKDNRQYRRLIKPANVDIKSNAGFAEWGNQLVLKGVVFDFYVTTGTKSGRDVWAAVIWDQRTPVNVQLVERGVGVPEVDPPTAIVNQIYSQYYWQKAVNGE